MAPKEEVQRRLKRIALILIGLVVFLLVVGMIWWGNLADADIERGPVEPGEAITDSADDRGG